MRRYLKYFWYVIVHKYHVAVGCRKVGLSWWTAIIHDYDKFHPGMFISYARFFYYPNGIRINYGDASQKDRTNMLKWWRWHYGRNKHHWEYWVEDMIDYLPMTGETREIIPQRDVLEMVADWYGAGIAINGKEDVYNWYHEQTKNNRINMELDSVRATNLVIDRYFPYHLTNLEHKPNV